MELGTFPSERQRTLAWRRTLLGDPCAYCGEGAAVADHIVAQALGGEPGWSNMTGCCAACNFSKGTRTMLAFLTGEPIGLDNWAREHLRQRLAWVRQDNRWDYFFRTVDEWPGSEFTL